MGAKLTAFVPALTTGQRDIQVIAASRNGKDTLLKINSLKPQVILLDLGLRSQNSLHLVELVKNEFPKVRVIMMDLDPVKTDIIQFVKAGASGFILKDATLDDFLATIRAVAKGAKVLPPKLSESFFTQIAEHAVTVGKIRLKEAVRMTARERQVIRHLSDGLTNKEIAQRLRVATHTIKSHVHNIMEKLVLNTRLEVAKNTNNDGALKTIARGISSINN